MAELLDESNLIARCELFLDKLLPAVDEQPCRLHEAMRYAVLSPGKRLRPLLVYASGHTFGLPRSQSDYIAAAVECIHAYSLIHDDLPAMDDDDLRRGKPTCHKAFDEATAILAGDALQSLAFTTLTQFADAPELKGVQSELVKMLGVATGSRGMAGGQMFDIQSPHGINSIVDLSRLHQMKTGALIRVSLLMPAVLAQTCSASTLNVLSEFADCVGLGFQICDDIIDVEVSDHYSGKSSGSDARLNKITYPSLMGMEEAKQCAQSLLEQSLGLLGQLPQDTQSLAILAQKMILRDR